MEKFNIGIIGYGNLGKALYRKITICNNMRVSVVFSRRKADEIEVSGNTIIDNVANIEQYYGKLDAVAVTVGSATDLIPTTIKVAKLFNTIDSFDNHNRIGDYFNILQPICNESKKISLISCGWDPGIMSIMRAFFAVMFPYGETTNFWGKGVSSGHTQALKQIEGVCDALQFTIPNKRKQNAALKGKNIENSLSLHTRMCYVSLNLSADKKRVYHEIVSMPDYFEPYKTKIKFVSEETIHLMKKNLSHQGMVIRNIFEPQSQLLFKLKTENNSDFTASIMAAFLPAIIRLNREGQIGAKTIYDIPLNYLLNNSLNYL
ncbi:MAG: diaminopimelate dehydrogenase [Clostridia bacterium]